MGKKDLTPDWSLIQSFLAVAETGSLSAAARRLDRSQPTLGRQIQMLDSQLQTQLFERHARGFRLTATGRELLPLAERMREAMGALTLIAAGQSEQLEGTVRISASIYMSHFVLPPIIARIRQSDPRISIVLMPTDRIENLLFREADIAIRMVRPTQMDVVTRHIADLDMGVFAAKTYLERAGRPKTVQELLDHDIIGFDRSEDILSAMREQGHPVVAEDFPVRCDNHAVYWELLRAGCGIGFSQVQVGQAEPLVEQIELDIPIPPLAVWLTAHQAMRQTPRIRRVWDLLAAGLTI